MKLCIDCRHFIPMYRTPHALSPSDSRCDRGERSLVDGRSEAFARPMRERGSCGPEGKLWEAKEPPAGSYSPSNAFGNIGDQS